MNAALRKTVTIFSRDSQDLIGALEAAKRGVKILFSRSMVVRFASP